MPHDAERARGEEMTLGLGIVGLGVQGRRMTSRLPEHGGFRVVAGWDPDPASARLAESRGIPIVQAADAVIAASGVDCLFIASPPASHLKLANAAFDRGLPVFCEVSETGIEARLRVRAVAVEVQGSVGGPDADFNRFALVGDRATLELRDWLATRWSGGSRQPEPPAADTRPGYLRQLDQLAAFIRGEPHVLPDFAEALAVQETIESLLASP
jgi:predicted dehydrogenase